MDLFNLMLADFDNVERLARYLGLRGTKCRCRQCREAIAVEVARRTKSEQ